MASAKVLESKKEIVAQAAKLSLKLVTKPELLANLMTIFGGAVAK